MQILYTPHAVEKSTIRRISHKQIWQAISTPDILTVSFRNRFVARKSFHDKTIGIVYTKEYNYLIIITVILYEES